MSSSQAIPSIHPAGAQTGGLSLFETDLWMWYRLLQEARYRTLGAVFGVDRSGANVITLIGAAAVVAAVYGKLEPILKAPGKPSVVGTVASAGLARAGLTLIAGPGSENLPLGAVVVVVAASKLSRGPLGHAVHAVRETSRTLRSGFSARYGQVAGEIRRRTDELSSSPPSGQSA